MKTFNVLLDKLPRDYEGYLINTEFYTGILISECLADSSMPLEKRLSEALHMLYGNGVPQDMNLAVDGLQWFLSGGIDEDKEKGDSEEGIQFMSFEDDAERIYSAFYRCFKIDLQDEDLHWFKFLYLLQDTGDTSLQNAIQWRTLDDADIRDMPKRKQAEARKTREKMRIRKEPGYTEEELEAIRRFNDLRG